MFLPNPIYPIYIYIYIYSCIIYIYIYICKYIYILECYQVIRYPEFHVKAYYNLQDGHDERTLRVQWNEIFF